jgi:hypothetical protein
MIIRVDQPHGYLRDGYGNIVLRFANWQIGEHNVPDPVESVDYVDGPNAHEDAVADQYQDDTL